jgi:purine-nucleoside phosphorylase
MNTTHSYADVAAACRERFGEPPSGVIVLGSGLGPLLDQVEDAQSVPYPEIGLPQTGVVGHAGHLVVGMLGGERIAMLSGRVHSYEGHPLEVVVCAVRAMAAWGVKRLVMTSAVGSLNTGLQPGDLIRITDHINLMGINPLVGPNIEALGPRFPDVSEAYSPALGALVEAEAMAQGTELKNGVYAAVRGPSYETPAEVRMLGLLGGHVVGMSVVPETLAAVHAGMQVLVVAVVSNPGTGLTDEPPAHDQVTAVVGRSAAKLGRLIKGLVQRW